MVSWTFYRLKPKPGTGFHFGQGGFEEESAASCPSDTLFAALVATEAALNGDQGVQALVAPFIERKPPFLLTSLFPFIGDLPLLPLPHIRLVLPEGGVRRHKRLKKLRYVSPAIWQRILAREPLEELFGEEGIFLQDGQVWISAAETAAFPDAWRDLLPIKSTRWREWLRGADGRRWLRQQKIWAFASVDRVTVDRLSSASAVYRIGRTVYSPGCGLWFGLQWPDGVDDSTRSHLEVLLHFLGDQGLGGERSIGYGQFTWERAEWALNLPEAKPYAPLLTLSRYLPRPGELPEILRGEEVAYKLVTVSGWLYAPGHGAYRRRKVRFLAPGSVFYAATPAPWGQIADVHPLSTNKKDKSTDKSQAAPQTTDQAPQSKQTDNEHADKWNGPPIWRYGYACPIGLPEKHKKVSYA